MLDALSVPPRLIVRALDDLHTLAEGIRRLTDREGDLTALVESAKMLPRTEDELSENIAARVTSMRSTPGSSRSTRS
jgi:hypothetical protein